MGCGRAGRGPCLRTCIQNLTGFTSTEPAQYYMRARRGGLRGGAAQLHRRACSLPRAEHTLPALLIPSLSTFMHVLFHPSRAANALSPSPTCAASCPFIRMHAPPTARRVRSARSQRRPCAGSRARRAPARSSGLLQLCPRELRAPAGGGAVTGDRVSMQGAQGAGRGRGGASPCLRLTFITRWKGLATGTLSCLPALKRSRRAHGCNL